MEQCYAYSENEYKAAWKTMVNGQSVTTLDNLKILNSWERCKTMNVNPWQKTVKAVLDTSALDKIKENNKLFLDVSMPTLENLYRFVEGSGFVVALSDNNGNLIEVFGDNKVRDSVQQGNWAPGAVWNEASAGTNIVGTPLYLDEPVAIIGYQHFCRCSHRYQGAGAPIHDSDGRILGIVALAGAVDKTHPHTLGMIVAAANAIEIQFSMKKAWMECDLANQHKSVIVNTIYEGLLVTDNQGIITLVNKRAQEILNLPNEELLGVPVKSLFSENFIGTLERKRYQVIDFQEEITVGKTKIKCTITCQNIMCGDCSKGLVIVINELSRATKLLNKLLMQDTRFTFENIIGKNAKFCNALKTAKIVAPKESNVLLLGESGTGKDVFAQAIHNASSRRRGPFIAVNCGAIPKELIGSELFGYSEGAFTGAKKGGKMGKFELADGGTLFLDEIGEMPIEQQKVLLRVLEDRKIIRLGGHEPIPINVRIIAATNIDLENEVKKGTFRQDVYYRLNVFAIKMVPLRERKDDIRLLAAAFLESFSRDMGRTNIDIVDEVWDLLLSYDWPGNVRELQNAIERALVLSEGQTITPNLFDFYISNEQKPDSQSANPIKNALHDYETDILTDILARNNWNISKTSIYLGISRTTLYRKMSILGIKIPGEYRNLFN